MKNTKKNTKKLSLRLKSGVKAGPNGAIIWPRRGLNIQVSSSQINQL